MQDQSVSIISRRIEAFVRIERADNLPPNFDVQSDLIESGTLDSMFLMQVVAFLEQEYSISLPPDRISPENFHSVSRISSFVHELLKN